MEQTLASGAKLNITVAPFIDSHNLLKAILKAVKGMKLSEEALGADMSLEGIKGNLSLFSSMVDKILSIAISDEVEQALFKCMERVTYNDIKLKREMFDDPKLSDQLREDYYMICWYVIEANCKPFFKTTFSGLKMSSKTSTENQK